MIDTSCALALGRTATVVGWAVDLLMLELADDKQADVGHDHDDAAGHPAAVLKSICHIWIRSHE
jgi:hypothetical protein